MRFCWDDKSGMGAYSPKPKSSMLRLQAGCGHCDHSFRHLSATNYDEYWRVVGRVKLRIGKFVLVAAKRIYVLVALLNKQQYTSTGRDCHTK